MKKRIYKLEPPLSFSYKYFGIHFQKFIDKKKDGLTPINAVRYLQEYSNKRKIGLSARSNLRKAIIHIVRLTLFKHKMQDQEIYYREALKMFKVRKPLKTVMAGDIPTPEDLQVAKENSHIKVALFISFVSVTCLRIGEVVRIKLINCRYDKLSDGYTIKFIRKGGYQFETWIPKELYNNIVFEYGSTVWLFQSPYTDKTHLNAGTAQRWLRQASKYTSRPIRPHLIRHKSINEVVKENPHIPLHVLCDAFGHSESTLKAYYLNKDKVDVTAINKKHYLNLKKSEGTVK
jgi:integrase